MHESNHGGTLVGLIDKLAPINNKFRGAQDPIKKIETMWDFGQILDSYLRTNNVKLHELLYQIYDPYSRVKMSYITRDLGSYCYRVYNFFPDRTQIGEMLKGIKSYTAFRESIPLLFNATYGLTEAQKKEVVSIISSNKPVSVIVEELKHKKRSIRPINNPRNQRSEEYIVEKEYLSDLKATLKEFYSKNETLPSRQIVDDNFGVEQFRSVLVDILMALASEAFISKVDKIDENLLINEIKDIYNIAKSNSQDRSRFRKWVFSANELLSIAEAIHSLSDTGDYISYRNKLIV